MLRPLATNLRDDLNVERLFDEEWCLAASPRSRWSRRRNLSFADLVDASWITPFTGATPEKALFEAFRTLGLPQPRVAVWTLSGQLRDFLSLRGTFIALVPASFFKNPRGYGWIEEIAAPVADAPYAGRNDHFAQSNFEQNRGTISPLCTGCRKGDLRAAPGKKALSPTYAASRMLPLLGPSGID
jgi:hypothetical protein